MPGGPRGLQNRRRFAMRVEVSSILTLSAIPNSRISRSVQKHPASLASGGRRLDPRKEVTAVTREQVLKLTSLSSSAG